jgi:hypothetical protein
MTSARRTAALSLGFLLAAGCGSSGGGGADAGTDAATVDLGCLGAPLPTTAPATLNLGGKVVTTSLTGTSPVPGASVSLYASDGGVALATATSTANGLFSFQAASGGAPIDGYLHVTSGNYVEVYWYPSAPLAADTSTIQVAMLLPSTLNFLSSVSGATQPLGAGMGGMDIVDCAGVPLAGAVMTSVPVAGNTTYVINQSPLSSATSTDASGSLFLFDLAAGQVTLGATLGAHTLRSHAVTVRPDVVTESSVQP